MKNKHKITTARIVAHHVLAAYAMRENKKLLREALTRGYIGHDGGVRGVYHLLREAHAFNEMADRCTREIKRDVEIASPLNKIICKILTKVFGI